MKGLLIATLLLLGSVGANAQDSAADAASDFLGPGNVATVNGKRVPESVFRLYTLGGLQVNPDALTPEAKKEVVTRLIYTLLLAEEAERRGLPQERRIAAQLELQRLQTLATFMSERHARENPPTEQELRAVYEENLPRLERTEYKARHIIVETEREAERLIADLDDGDDFAELAQEHSTGANASVGGDLGWLSVDTTVNEPFAEALVATTPGTHYPEPVQTEYGWHVIRVDETRQAPPPTMSSIQDELIAAVDAVHLQAFVDSLFEAADVELVD